MTLQAAAGQARLLIVDDEEALMTALCNTLRTEGYAVTGTTSSLLQAAQDIDPDIAGVVMTGNATVDTAVQALRGGALDLGLTTEDILQRTIEAAARWAESRPREDATFYLSLPIEAEASIA